MILRLRIHIPAAVDVDVPPLFWQAIFFRVLYRKMEKDSLCSHRCPSVKGKLQRGGSNSRYRTRCCNRTVQGSGYDVDTEIFQEEKYMDYFNAFWTGGLICALVQILLDRTKLMPGRIMVLLVCTGSVLSAVGIYQPFAEFAGAGASVPLLGFGNILWKGMKESIDKTD